MDAVLASTIDILEDVKLPDWQSELAFTEARHTEQIAGLQTIDSSWRLKERIKTVSVALVLCLNVGVDPPDINKIEPCAHLECWFDPLSEEPQKAIEFISLQLEKQYEQWHSRARYKKCLDPTVEEVKRLCTSLRRYSKEDRVLFHYNGHGVPRPTQNGEIWVFNEKYTQYIPLAIYDLQQWMGSPSIYVFDCSCAGSIVESFLEFAKQHRRDYGMELIQYNAYLQAQSLINSQNITKYSTDNNTNSKSNSNQQQSQPPTQNGSPKETSTNSKQDSQKPQQQPNKDNNNTQLYKDSKTTFHEQTPTNGATVDKNTDSNENSTNSSDQQANATLTNANTTNNNNNIPLKSPPIRPPDYNNCFQLAACEAHQILPLQPDLPADLFTSCLTTPIKMALRWFIQKNDLRLIPKVTLDLVDKIPGSLSDRRTMLGELNWIFTAITDTIAWDVLPRNLFQRLYRQDLLVASLFRNFLLADRIMRTYDCTPVSYPKLPKTYHHPMWRAWDMVVDLCLSQLVDVLEDRAQFKTSTFFAEQLTAFEVWLDLDHSINQQPDHQLLPIILQVLLSPVHRLRALDLLSRFLNLGPGAVNSALSVGIFPYVLKLLQSNAREVRPFLLSIWAKILAIDRRCQVDLVRDNYHRYFLTILSDGSYDAHYRTMAAFVLTCIVRDYPQGQEAAYQANLIAFCLEQLDDPDPMLRKWLAICLGTSWENYEDARWCGVRSCAHEKLYTLLDDLDAEVRAAVVFALGTFINSSSERSDHANTIDHSIGLKLVSTSLYDSSILVRHELVVALQYLVLKFENQFLKLEQAARDEERKVNYDITLGGTPSSLNSSSRVQHASGFLSPTIHISRPAYHVIWKAINTLAADPHPKISSAAQVIIDEVKSRTLITTDFVDWCTKFFIDPENNHTTSRCSSSKENQQREWRMLRCLSYKNVRLRELMVIDPIRFNDTLSSYKVSQVPNLITIHPYDPIMIVAGRDEFTVMHLDGPHVNNYESSSTLTSSMSSASLASNSSLTGNSHHQNHGSFHLYTNNHHYNHNHHHHNHHHHHNNNLSFSNNYISGDSNGTNGANNFGHYLVGTQNNCHSNSSRITSMQLINPQYNTLIYTGSSDGTVKIWRAYNGIDYTFNPQLVTAFHLMPELQTNHHYNQHHTHSFNSPHQQSILSHSLTKQTGGGGSGGSNNSNNSASPGPTSMGMILLWDQNQGKFYATSDQNDVRTIKVWDAQSESKIQDIPTCAEFGVSCMTSDGEHSIAAGFLDGSIRIYDTRLKKTDCRTFTFRKHSEKILTLHMFKPGEKHINLVSGDLGGEVRFWDKRAPTSVKRVDVGQEMSVMSVHPNADVFACGLKSGQEIKIYNLDGTSRAGCIIKCQDNTFFGSRHNSSVNCLAFHPLKTSLVAGFTDSVVSIYSSRTVC